ncbi:MAG: response regulator [Myxococcales bacterium]|nr:MAG: response regulator [Myxococcales bacterium]
MDEAKRILVVDDVESNRKLLVMSLTRLGYDVDQADDGMEAIEHAHATPPELIILDLLMPRLDGWETARRLKADAATRNIPILVVSTHSEVKNRVSAFEAGADDFLSKPVDQVELKTRVKSLLKVKSYNDHMLQYQKRLEEEVARRTEQLERAYEKIRMQALDTIFRLSQAAEYKDEDTGAHIIRIGYYSAAIARQMGLADEEIDAILHASPMHDIGKIGIPDHVLLKPGKLTPEEWEVMKRHTVIGAQILAGSDSEVIGKAEEIALSHHERIDGSGYPKGLKGEAIPLAGRIVALADVFDALLSRRPYKQPFSLEQSLGIIREMGDQEKLDPDVTQAFFAIENEITAIRRAHPEGDASPA